MKLRKQVMALGLAGAVVAAAVGGIGLIATARLGGSIEASVQASQALQASQEADMMHDAIRGDGQMALFGLLQKEPARIRTASEGLQSHADTFNAALARLEALPLNEDSRTALASVKPLVASYIEAAQGLVVAAREGRTDADSAMATLQAAFAELEKQMASLSDSIEQRGVRVNEEAATNVRRTRGVLAVVLVLAFAGMAAASWWLAGRMTRPMAHAVDVADRLAQGDLTGAVRPEGNDETVKLLESMGRMQADFGAIVRDVQGNAAQVANASAEIAQGNHDLSVRTERQASALQQTAATMSELGDTVRHNADSARQANQLALDASGLAAEGGRVVGQVVDTMQGIADSARRIEDIIGVIDAIAFQTNILALNAAVEAARAGAAGTGFAVVAEEVRALAGRSGDAAREIKVLIGTSAERVDAGTAYVGQAGRTMDEIVAAIGRVAGIVGEISEASTRQSAGVDQVGRAIGEMDETTQQNAALVEQSAAAAESLKGQAARLVQAVAAFRLG